MWMTTPMYSQWALSKLYFAATVLSYFKLTQSLETRNMSAVVLSLWFVSLFLCSSCLDQGKSFLIFFIFYFSFICFNLLLHCNNNQTSFEICSHINTINSKGIDNKNVCFRNQQIDLCNINIFASYFNKAFNKYCNYILVEEFVFCYQ